MYGRANPDYRGRECCMRPDENAESVESELHLQHQMRGRAPQALPKNTEAYPD